MDHLTYSHNRLINIPQYGESVADGLAMLRIHNHCTNRDVDVGMLIGMLMLGCWDVDWDVDVGVDNSQPLH